MAGELITSIVSRGKRSKTADVYVDGDFWRTVNRRAAHRAGLHSGLPLDPSLLSSLEKEERLLAEEAALRLLTYRARSTSEITRRLTASGFSMHVVTELVEHLSGIGYLDDTEFARSWIEDRMRVKGYGRQRIARELASRGVDRETVEAELDRLCDDEHETERALALLERRLHSRTDLEAGERQKIFAWLLRRGFPVSTARDVLGAYQERGEGQEPSGMPSP